MQAKSIFAFKVLSLLFVAAIVSCNAPLLVPVSQKLIGPGSVPLNTEPNTSQIRVGMTTRSDVERQFQAVNTEISSSRVFLARWERSGIENGPARVWGARSILIQFDAQGIVTRFDECGDGKLLKLLPEYLAGATSVPTFSPQIEKPTIGSGPLIFNKDSLEFEGQSWPRSSLVKLAYLGSTYANNLPDPCCVNFDLVIKKHSNVSVRTSVATAVLLIQYIAQNSNTFSSYR